MRAKPLRTVAYEWAGKRYSPRDPRVVSLHKLCRGWPGIWPTVSPYPMRELRTVIFSNADEAKRAVVLLDSDKELKRFSRSDLQWRTVILHKKAVSRLEKLGIGMAARKVWMTRYRKAANARLRLAVRRARQEGLISYNTARRWLASRRRQ